MSSSHIKGIRPLFSNVLFVTVPICFFFIVFGNFLDLSLFYGQIILFLSFILKKIILGDLEVSANLYCNSRASVLWRLRDYLRLLMVHTLPVGETYGERDHGRIDPRRGRDHARQTGRDRRRRSWTGRKGPSGGRRSFWPRVASHKFLDSFIPEKNSIIYL